MAADNGSDASGGGVRSWLKRPVVWIGGIVVAALGVAITNALVPWFGSMIDTLTQRGDPIEVIDAQPYKSDEAGGTVAFPVGTTFTDAQIDELDASSDGFMWLLEHGGAPVGRAFVRILLEGNRSETVRIVDADLEDDCGEPLDGALFLDPPAGADSSIRLDFDLDAADPVATARNEAGETVQFFPSQTISLAKDEQVPLVVTGGTQEHSCTFRVRLTVLDGDTETVLLVPDADDPPFRVSAKLDDAAYETVYLGGVACGGDGGFVRASETYFASGVEPACQG